MTSQRLVLAGAHSLASPWILPRFDDVLARSQILARAEKRALLLQWLEHEKALLVADDEGMQGDRPSQIDLVHRALRALEK